MTNSAKRSSNNSNLNNEELGNVPELRFPEFGGEWIETTLNDVTSDACYGVGAAATDFDGENKYLRITDIDDESHKFVPSPLVSPEGTIEEKYLVKENDLLFARTGASVGKSYLYDKKDGKLIYAGFLIKFNVSKAYPKFVFYNTCKSRYDNWVRIMSMRSGQPGINLKEYQKYDFKIPSEQEQKKIADFLSTIDKKIELMEKKMEYIKKLKTYFLKHLFCNNEEIENIPELRFPEFNGEWTTYKLGDICEFSKGKGISKNDVTEEGTPCIRYGELYTQYGELITETVSNTQLTLDKLVLSEENDIIIPSTGETAIDISQASCIKKDNIAIGGDINILKTREDGVFLSYYLNYIKTDIAKMAQGISVIHLYADQLKSLTVNIPSIEEQRKISNLLLLLNQKIDSMEKEIQMNKNFKFSLLTKMFC